MNFGKILKLLLSCQIINETDNFLLVCYYSNVVLNMKFSTGHHNQSYNVECFWVIYWKEQFYFLATILLKWSFSQGLCICHLSMKPHITDISRTIQFQQQKKPGKILEEGIQASVKMDLLFYQVTFYMCLDLRDSLYSHVHTKFGILNPQHHNKLFAYVLYTLF